MRQPMWPLLPMERRRSIERRARHRLLKLARLGHGAKGIVYLLVGLLAANAAWSGHAAGSGVALRSMVEGTGGTALLVLLALGLAAHASWCLHSAATGSAGDGGRERAGQLTTCLLYGALAVQAAVLALDPGSSGEHWTSALMSEPLGPWLAGALGLTLIAYAAYQLRGAVSGPVELELDVGSMQAQRLAWVKRIGRIGVSAKAVAIAAAGLFLLIAGLRAGAGQAAGVGSALRGLADQPPGSWLLGAIAVGLAAYGAFQMLKAAYPPVTLRRAA